jgi:hypothetical protein
MQLYLADALGFAGTGIALGSYVARSHRVLCSSVAAGMVLLSAHFWLLGAFTAAWLCLFSAGRSFAAPAVSELGKPYRLAATAIGVACVLLLGTVTWQDWHSVLAILGTGLLVVFSFNLKDRRFRHSLLAVECVFAANSVAIGSVPGLCLALTGFALNALVLIRQRPSSSQATSAA